MNVLFTDIPQQHPSQQTSENGMDGSIKPLIAAGQQFYMIQGRKGVYIGTMCGRIFAIRSQKTDERNTASPLVRAWNGQVMKKIAILLKISFSFKNTIKYTVEEFSTLIIFISLHMIIHMAR